MSNYYKTQMIVFEKIDQLLAQGINEQKPIRINAIILQLTKNYPVSAKAIEKRIELFVSENNSFLEIKDGEVRLCQ